MNSFLLQKQLQDNSNDLKEFCKELKDWSNEMKRKEDEKVDSAVGSSKIKKPKKHIGGGDALVKSSRKFAGTDYAAWEKFDVEKECERIDNNENNSDSELSDEYDDSLRDEAMLEKEKGNKFVKNQQWDEAIECYTKAIGCYGYDPIFYANRALCFLKKEKWKKAESDATVALQLDKSYVKAYQRRAAARVKLGQLLEAKADLEEVLKYEPKNIESKTTLDTVLKMLDETQEDNNEKCVKPVSKFTQARQNKKMTVLQNKEEKTKTSSFDLGKATVVERKQTFVWPEDNSINIIEAISKPPHIRSKVPLKRVTIKDIETKPIVHTKLSPIERTETEREQPLRKENKKKSVSFVDVKESIKVEKTVVPSIIEFVEPITSVQFFAQWKQFNDDLNLKYEYLRVMNPSNLKEVFKESLDSKTFSDILKVLNKYSDDRYFVFNFLMGLSEVKRFCTLVFFMSKADKDVVRAIADALKASGDLTEDDIKSLLKKFDL